MHIICISMLKISILLYATAPIYPLSFRPLLAVFILSSYFRGISPLFHAHNTRARAHTHKHTSSPSLAIIGSSSSAAARFIYVDTPNNTSDQYLPLPFFPFHPNLAPPLPPPHSSSRLGRFITQLQTICPLGCNYCSMHRRGHNG